MSSVKLTVLSGLSKSQKFEFDFEIRIGRAESNPICIPDSSVSSDHALIRFDEDKLQATSYRKILTRPGNTGYASDLIVANAREAVRQ